MSDELKASPQNQFLAPFARGLRNLQELAAQYQVDPRIPLFGGTGVDEMLGLPGAASLTEDLSYYGPRALIRGGNVATGGIGTFRPDPRVTDLADVVGMAAPLPVLGKQGVMKGARALEGATVGAAQRARIRAAAARVPDDAAYAPLRERMETSGNLAYAVKPKGGNWITGGFEAPNVRVADDYMQMPIVTGDRMNAVAGRDLASEYRAVNEADPTVSVHSWLKTTYPEVYSSLLGKPGVALNSWLDKTLTKYIKNEMATSEDRVRLGADAWAQERRGLLSQKDAQIAAARQAMEEARQARGFTPEMMTQSQARIRELQKERDYIAAQKGTHMQTDYDENVEMMARRHRDKMGLLPESSAKSDPGALWEAVSDLSVHQKPYRHYVDPSRMHTESGELNLGSELERIGGKYAVENPNALAYSFSSRFGYDMELGHMVDEMQNALNANSGLPKELLIDPDKLSKMSVADVSRHVDKINAWRATQEAEANRAIAGNAATQIVKEYPEQGMRWVELRLPEVKPEDALPEGYRVVSGEIKGKKFYHVLDPEGDSVVNKGGSMIHVEDTEEEAVQKALKSLGLPKLQEALKYEGEQLQHCVGGYCPDVEEGKSRIFSLRTEEGKPQVTIEALPGKRLTENEVRDLLADVYGDDSREAFEAAVQGHLNEKTPDRINQIKGLRNAPPREQREFVLDFLADRPDIQFTGHGKDDLNNLGIVDTDPKNGTWRSVLEDKADHDQYSSAQQLDSTINDVMHDIMEYNPNTPRFIKREDLQKMLMDYDFAEGGLVSTDYNPAAVDAAVNKFYEGYHG